MITDRGLIEISLKRSCHMKNLNFDEILNIGLKDPKNVNLKHG